MRRVGERVPLETCIGRALAYLAASNRQYNVASSMADTIWPGATFIAGQGAGAAVARVLAKMKRRGLVRWGSTARPVQWGWRITDAGRAELRRRTVDATLANERGQGGAVKGSRKPTVAEYRRAIREILLASGVNVQPASRLDLLARRVRDAATVFVGKVAEEWECGNEAGVELRVLNVLRGKPHG